jgi:hypothetical protein
LQDDAGRDVGHDAQRKDRQLKQRTAGEQIDQGVEPLLLAGAGLLEAKAHLFDVDVWRGNDRTESEDRKDRKRKEDLLA